MSHDQKYPAPWASFCMSTFNRPAFLEEQVGSLLQQTFTDFEIVIADNDPQAGGRAVAESFKDARVKYECNGENIGMLNSFNRSIGRARGEYVVMITDDDPVENNFLEVFNKLVDDYPGFSFYGGLQREGKDPNEIEIIHANDFISEFLDTGKSTNILWSSCLVKRATLLQIGGLVDYGSPHLVDHAMLSTVGSIDGGVFVNKMYSRIVYHTTNFSKSNFDYYYIAAAGFYRVMDDFIKDRPSYGKNRDVITKHLGKWAINCMFALINYYKSAANYDKAKVDELWKVADKLFRLPFMRRYRLKYYFKSLALFVKYRLGIRR